MLVNCCFCNSEIKSIRGRIPRACLSSRIKVLEPNRCWKEHGNVIQKLCVLSAPHNRVTAAQKKRVYSHLTKLGVESLKGEQACEVFFCSLSPFERDELIEFSVEDLKEKLTTIAAKHKLTVLPEAKITELPEDLSYELESLINDYRTMLLKRYKTLLEKGHTRSEYYVTRESTDAIRFVRYLAKIGFNSWTGVSRKELVGYLADENAKLSNSLKRFIKYANNKKNPLRKIKTGKPKRSGTVLTETPRPKIVPSEMVDSLLKSIKLNHTPAEYLLAWLVCRLGLTLIKSYKLNLAQIKINDDGKCVIKPSEVWVSLPPNIEKVLIDLADENYPKWREESEEKLEYLEIFPKLIPNRHDFSKEVLQGHSRELRSSAIFALMLKGHTDRVTIKRTTGMSMPTIVKLESLLSVDLHRRLDPEFIKLRNQHITGEIKNGG